MKMGVEGLDALILDLDELTQMPDTVLSDMLHAGGEVVAEAPRNKIQSIGLVDTGQLLESITVASKIKSKKNSKSIEIYPKGTRNNGVRNDEVAFVYEFGAPSRDITAWQWMRNANEQIKDVACEAAEEVYDNYLRSKNLL